MNPKPSANRAAKTILASMGISIILGLILFIGYIFVRSLPAFYISPNPVNKVDWTSIPRPVVTNPNWRSWTTANKVNDALWINDLVWVATKGGVSVQAISQEEHVKFLPEHGLPSGNVTAITSDASGRIWVGTRDSGVARYDGLQWETFRGREQIPSDQINDIYAAQNGVVWAATNQGLARFDGNTWSNVRFSLFDISNPRVTGVVGQGNDVWVATNEGVYYFNGSDWLFYGLNEGVINEFILDITISPDRSVWVATPSGIGQFDGLRWNRFTVKDGLPDLPATQILAAPDKTVWITFEDLSAPEFSQTVRFDGFAP
ncbi:MAG: two-component regulator propeller domain-containing protein, partial [Chloroflexota bacterium]